MEESPYASPAGPAQVAGPGPLPAAPGAVPAGGRKARTGRRRLVIILAVLGALGFIGIVGFLLLVIAAMAAVSMGAGAVSEALLVRELEPGDSTRPVVAVEVHGFISGGVHAGGNADAIIKQLRKIRREGKASAILLDVNSGGGGVTASDAIHREVQRCREAGLPVVAFFRNLAASGGYYVSAGADRIVIMPTGITGSIGVRAMSISAKKLLEEKIGLTNEEVTSAPMKDAGPPWRPLTPAARERLHQIVDEMHERFVGVIADGRKGLTREAAAALATGEVYSAKQAEANGLVDEIGYWSDAVAAARGLGGVPGAAVVRYVRRPTGLRALLGVDSASPAVRVELAPRLPEVPSLRLEYIWAPEFPAPAH